MTLNIFSEKLPLIDLSIGMALILLAVLIFAVHGLYAYFRSRRRKKAAEKLPYEHKTLLSEQEMAVYTALRPLAAQRGLHILSKVRVADFITVSPSCVDVGDWNEYFGRIRAKHVDFMLADPEKLDPRLLIEVEFDAPHLPSAQHRRQVMETIYRRAGLPIVYVETAEGLAEKIDAVLDGDNR